MAARKKPAVAAAAEVEQRQRGLLVSSKHIDKFFAPILQRKTAEIRNFQCRCVPKNGVFWLVESGLKDSFGKGVFRIRAKVEFGGNTFVNDKDLESHFARHRCSRSEYDEVSKKWSSNKGGFYMWDIKVLEILPTPLYIAVGPGQAGSYVKKTNI